MKQKLITIIALVALFLVPQGVWADSTYEELYSLTTTGDFGTAGEVVEGETPYTKGTAVYAMSAGSYWTAGATDADPWTIGNSGQYIKIAFDANFQFRVGDQIIIKAKSTKKDQPIRGFIDGTHASSSDVDYIGFSLALPTTEAEQIATLTADNKLIGKNAFYLRWSTSSATASLYYIKVKRDVTNYTITLPAATAQGSVTSDVATALPGTLVTLTPTAGEGYLLAGVTVMNGENEVALSEDYKFTMPAGNVTVSATFVSASALYNVEVATNLEHGQIVADLIKAKYNDIVTISVAPEAGYELDVLTVMKGETPIAVSDDYKFTMPAGNVSVTATFKIADKFRLLTTGDGKVFYGAYAIEDVDQTTDTEDPKRWSLESAAAYIKCTANYLFAAGDKIVIVATPRSGASAGFKVCKTNSTEEADVYTTIPGVSSKQNVKLTLEYAIEANSELVGKSEFYIMLDAANRKYWIDAIQVTTETAARTAINDIVIEEAEGGTVTPDVARGVEGATITLTVEPSDPEYYELESLNVYQMTDAVSDTPSFAPAKRAPALLGNITLTEVDATHYTFTMPAEKVTVVPTFRVLPTNKRSVTVTKEWMVFCSPMTLALPESGLKAYTISAVTAPEGTEQGTVTLVSQTHIVNDVPMLLHNEDVANTIRYRLEIVENGTITIPEAEQCGEFVGSSTAATPMLSSNVNYVLKDGMFIRSTATQTPQYSCFLQLTPNAAASARSFAFDFDESHTTGISEMERMRNGENETFFDLMGRKVAQPAKGLYIVNGKKVVLK